MSSVDLVLLIKRELSHKAVVVVVVVVAASGVIDLLQPMTIIHVF